MKIFTIALYVFILTMSFSLMTTMSPFIFPDSAEWISGALPSFEGVNDSVENLKAATGLFDSGADSNVFMALGLTVYNGIALFFNVIIASITVIPSMLAYFGAPVALNVIITGGLWLITIVSAIQLITGRYFSYVE